MKRYILFTNEDIKNLSNGDDIKHFISGVGEVHFMSKEHFMKSLSEDDPDEED